MVFLKNADLTETIFWIAAISGTVFLIFRIILLLFNGDFDFDNSDSPLPLDHDTINESTSDYSFKILSLNFISGFSMIFGWIGLSAYNQFKLNQILSFLIAIIVAYLAMLFTGYLFKLVMKLNSKGEIFDIKKTIGCIGEVYLTIPKDGIGKIKLNLQGISKIIEAVSENNEKIDSFMKISIVSIKDQNLVSVKKLNEEE